MNLNRDLPWNSALGGLILALLLTGLAPTARANVYATNVRIDGAITNVPATPNDVLVISYILNEPASGGVTIQLLSGANLVRSLTVTNGQGAVRGANTIVWQDFGTNLPNGTYSVKVVAASTGYTNWTQITSDTDDANTWVFEGHGIAVDRNPTSPFYGRVFVANSVLGFNPDIIPGDNVGILKFNADTSAADEGISSAGLDGHNWADNHVSPWKLQVSADDYVYVDDLANGGELFRWDPTLSSNSLAYVLRQDNQPAGAALSGPALAGAGASTQIWMANTNAAEIYQWAVGANGLCATNDTGRLVIKGAGQNFFDLALDPDNNLYTCTYVGTSGDTSPRVFRFPSSNGTLPLTNFEWAVGGEDDSWAGASGIAVDPSGTYVAVAFEGPGGIFSTNGNTKILWATNGALAANLDLGVMMQGDANHDDTACAWDAVGNIYYIDTYFSRWRAFSPPGTNQAATVAVANILLNDGSTPPPSSSIQITHLAVSGGNVNLDFSADTNDAATSFTILGAASVTGPFTSIGGAVITQTAPGLFHAVFPLGPTTQYFRISRQGTTPPPSGLNFTGIKTSGANVVLTFAGATTDSASAFTLLSSSTANGSYSSAPNAQIAQLSPGVFQASVPASGPVQFYRIRR